MPAPHMLSDIQKPTAEQEKWINVLKQAITFNLIEKLDRYTDKDETITNVDLGDGANALIFAIEAGSTETVKYLLDEGLTWTIYGYQGNVIDAYEVALKKGNPVIIQLVSDHKQRFSTHSLDDNLVNLNNSLSLFHNTFNLSSDSSLSHNTFNLSSDLSLPHNTFNLSSGLSLFHSTHEVMQTNTTSTTSLDRYAALTLADGNCAFNSVSRALSKALLNGQDDIIEQCHAYLMAIASWMHKHGLIISPPNPLHMLINTDIHTNDLIDKFRDEWSLLSTTQRQQFLSPLVRFKVVYTMFHPTIYRKMYQAGFEERLRAAYASYQAEKFKETLGELIYDDPSLLDDLSTINIVEDSANMLHFHFIREKLDNSPNLSEDEFIQWWRTKGCDIYFKIMITPALHANQPEKWGSDNEIALSALDFRRNFTLVRSGASHNVGIADGIIEISVLQNLIGPHNLNLLLPNLGLSIAERVFTLDENFEPICYFRFMKGAHQKIAAFSEPSPDIYLMDELIVQQSQGIRVSDYLKQHGYTAFECWLNNRGLLHNGYLLHTKKMTTTEGKDIYLPDLERIDMHLRGIPTSLARILGHLITPAETDATFIYENNHWFLVPNEALTPHQTPSDPSSAASSDHESSATQMSRKHGRHTEESSSSGTLGERCQLTADEFTLLIDMIRRENIQYTQQYQWNHKKAERISLFHSDKQVWEHKITQPIKKPAAKGDVYSYLRSIGQLSLLNKIKQLGLIQDMGAPNGYHFITNNTGKIDLDTIYARLQPAIQHLKITEDIAPPAKCMRLN